MFSALKYWGGAKPGIKRPTSQEEKLVNSTAKKKVRWQKAEVNRGERPLCEDWKTGRPWLVFDYSNNSMKCSTCIEKYAKKSQGNMKGQFTFLTGCTNRKVSAVTDHEISKAHVKAVEQTTAKERSVTEVVKTPAGKAINLLNQANRQRMCYLFRNAHAVAKQNRPMSDYNWLCDLDAAKGVDIGETYKNGQAALKFINCIADTEKEATSALVKNSRFFSFLMDGSTDISGDEQETIYIRTARKGVISERFLAIGTPESTCSKDLFNFVKENLEAFDLDTGQELSSFFNKIFIIFG